MTPADAPMDAVLAELSAAADLLITHEAARNTGNRTGPEAAMLTSACFLNAFYPARCGELADLIRRLRDEYRAAREVAYQNGDCTMRQVDAQIADQAKVGA